jgi:hypothetical protein
MLAVHGNRTFIAVFRWARDRPHPHSSVSRLHDPTLFLFNILPSSFNSWTSAVLEVIFWHSLLLRRTFLCATLYRKELLLLFQNFTETKNKYAIYRCILSVIHNPALSSRTLALTSAVLKGYSCCVSMITNTREYDYFLFLGVSCCLTLSADLENLACAGLHYGESVFQTRLTKR